MRTARTQDGYTLLLSVLISSIVLTIGIGLLNIVQKELLLAALGSDSQHAFYAADTGWECAFMHRIGSGSGGSLPATIECNNNSSVDASGGEFELYFDNGTCTLVTVEEVENTTKIEALGYRHGDKSGDDCPSDHPRQVERAIRATIQWGG